MELPLGYSLSGLQPVEAEDGGAGRCRLEAEDLSIMTGSGEALYFSLRDITAISAADYRIHIDLTSNETLTLFDLGYKYEDFLRVLSRFRNELVIKDMLMEETLKKSGVEAEFTHGVPGEEGQENAGECEVRLYETAFVLIPEKGEIVRIPYCYLSKITREDHSLVLHTESGEAIVLSRMGKHLDPFSRALSDALNTLSLKVQSTIKSLVPDADPRTVRETSRLMKEGLAARRSDIDSVCPRLWTEMERRIKDFDTAEEYEYLASLAQKDRMCIGLKRGLLGDLTGEYIWFLIPIYSVEPDRPGNLVAMESVSEESGSSATYFFRLVGRSDYPEFEDIEDLHRAADRFITTINRCMLAVNFRREPIYLPEERLREPRYHRYRIAVSRIPELRTLRAHFVGRVIHRSLDQWKGDVTQLLAFNTTASSDSARWTKEATKGG